ncbi:MAG: segregation and condensation protein B [Candidatus Omnitrophota bacterium]|jgi:segregation and condensation protein B
MEDVELKRAIEALLFVSEKQLTMEQIKDATKISEAKRINVMIDSIQAECTEQNRGFRLVHVAGGIQFVTDPALSDVVRTYGVSKEKRKLSAASLETLSIVAYKQPITRQEIEYIRGVNVDGAVRTLTDRGLLKIAGRKDVPGKPLLYATTKLFLEHFGLGGIRDLPRLAEFTLEDIDLPESLKPIATDSGSELAEPEVDPNGVVAEIAPETEAVVQNELNASEADVVKEA